MTPNAIPARRRRSRRQGAGFGLLLSFAILADTLRAAAVFDGVAAGDPSTANAILWTRLHNGGSKVDVTAQIATDANFADIVGSFSGSADAANDFTMKLKATGLTSNTRLLLSLRRARGASSAGAGSS